MIHDKNNILLTTQELLNSTTSQFNNYNVNNNFQRENLTVPNLNFNMNYNTNFNNNENFNNNFNQKYINQEDENSYGSHFDEISYYKNMLNKMNNEIGQMTNKLSVFENSSLSNNDLSSDKNNFINNYNDNNNFEIKNNINRIKLPNNDINNMIKGNNNIIKENNNNKLDELEENRKYLLSKNKEIDNQINELEKYNNFSNNNNYNKYNNNTIKVEKNHKVLTPNLKKSKKSISRKVPKEKDSKNLNNSYSLNSHRTFSKDNYSTTEKEKKITNLIPINDKQNNTQIFTQFELLKQMLNNPNNEKSENDRKFFLDKINSISIIFKKQLEQIQRQYQINLDKKEKKIQKLEKENEELKKKVNKIKEIMK